uniref:Uncharacterized protein n=1 Tax=Arundo donax TaxID=35708 RepID=A0A0A8ZU29_ARUDO
MKFNCQKITSISYSFQVVKHMTPLSTTSILFLEISAFKVTECRKLRQN